jgi:outer membrane protein assembly factor BamA
MAWQPFDKLWLTAGYRYASTEITIGKLEHEENNFLILPHYTLDIAQVHLQADWDSRPDQFYPTAGSLITTAVDVADSLVGSDRDYVTYEFSYNGYHTIDYKNVLAWRVAAMTVAGNPPFFALPWYGSGVDLRGYTPGRYIGRTLAAAQAEWRWQATKRVGFVAFGGTGGVWGDVRVFKQDDFLPAGGVGFRWRLTENFRLNFRVDYAWGRDDQVLLISAGEAF